jgi:hypothetical protein
VHSAQAVLWGKLLVVVSVVAIAAHLVGSSATMEHLVSTSGIVAVASKIEGDVFASISTFSSSAVA